MRKPDTAVSLGPSPASAGSSGPSTGGPTDPAAALRGPSLPFDTDTAVSLGPSPASAGSSGPESRWGGGPTDPAAALRGPSLPFDTDTALSLGPSPASAGSSGPSTGGPTDPAAALRGPSLPFDTDNPELVASRKNEHLRVSLEDQVEVAQPIGWGAIRLIPRALPDIARADVDPSVTFLGKRLAFPLIVGSMTGGTELAQTYNERLARAAARAGIGMGLGSQRVMLKKPELAQTFAVRDAAPDLPLLIANVGAVQLNYGVGLDEARRLVESVSADALVLHLNAAQEAVQPEGDTDFSGLADKMRALASLTPFPVGLKEVGAGFSSRDIATLSGSPFAFIESAGAGGTSWTLIEGLRKPNAKDLGALFADWGVPSVTSLLNCVSLGLPTIASGGLRSGLDAARALACGATTTAMALPLLKAAAVSEDAAYDAMMAFREALVTAMFLTGSRTVRELAQAEKAIDPRALPAVWEGRQRA